MTVALELITYEVAALHCFPSILLEQSIDLFQIFKMGLLPTEICIQILQMLPTSEIGVQTLMRCGMTGRCTLRDASMDPSMWKRYYLCRFIHSEPGKEKERQERFAGDWRLMYLERRQLDSKVIKQLQLVEAADTYSRIALAREIVILGRDIWDVLSIEAELPPPILFQTEEDIAKVINGSPLTNLARKFWASELLRLISSGDAAQLWTELYVTSTLGRNHYLECVMSKAMDPFTFEDVFAHLSSFHGVLADDVSFRMISYHKEGYKNLRDYPCRLKRNLTIKQHNARFILSL